jgi:predicted porin
LVTLGAIATIAQAQTAITIYGTVDAGVNFSNHNPAAEGSDGKGGSKFSLGSGNIDTSRIGFKGTEDLGSGLKALFQLEAGFDSSSGAAEDRGAFTRKAVVGLGGNFGTVLLGRQADMLDDAGHRYTSTKDFGNFAAGLHVLDRGCN